MKFNTILSSLVTVSLVSISCERKDIAEKNPHGSKSENTRFRRSGEREGKSFAAYESILQRITTKRNLEADELLSVQKQVSSLTTKEIQKLIDRLKGDRNSLQNTELFAVVMTEYAKREPEAALSWFSPGQMVKGESGFYEVCKVLGENRPDLVKKWLGNEISNVEEGLQGEMIAKALGALSKAKPEETYLFAVRSHWENYSRNSVIIDLFTELARQDPSAAENAAVSTLQGRDLEVARQCLAMTVGETDPDAGLAHAAKIPDALRRGRCQSSIIADALDTDRAQGTKLLKSLDTSDLQIVLQSSAGSFRSIVKTLAIQDPDVLLNLLSDTIPSSANEQVFRDAVESLGGPSPAKALQLLNSLPASEFKTSLIGARFSAMAKADPQDALNAASELPDTEMRKVVYGNIGSVVGRNGWESAMSTLNTLKKDDRTSFFDSAIPYLIEEDPNKIAKLLLGDEVPLSASKKREVLASLGSRFNASNPAFASDWLLSLPTGDQPFAMKGIAENMAKSDINELAKMLGPMAHDDTWKMGVEILIDNIKNSDPQMAQTWRSQLKDKQQER